MAAGPYELQIEQGVDRIVEITIKDKATGLAVDLTGWTFQLQIREKYTSPAVLYSPTVSIFSALGGVIRITLTATATAALPVKPLVYDLEGTRPDTKKIRILKGPVEVDPEVTR